MLIMMMMMMMVMAMMIHDECDLDVEASTIPVPDRPFTQQSPTESLQVGGKQSERQRSINVWATTSKTWFRKATCLTLALIYCRKKC